jgi:hypothetical protein
MKDFGEPGYWFEAFLAMWHQDWSDEFVNPYDAAERWLGRVSEPVRQEVVTGIDELLTLPDERSRRRRVRVYLPFDPGQFDDFLHAARRRALDPDATLVAPLELVLPEDVREGPYPEVQALARYVDGYVRGTLRSIYFEHGDREVDPGWATAFRVTELDELYSYRLLDDLAALRAGEPTTAGRLEAIGGTAVWDPAQDPDEWLDFVEVCARWKLRRGAVPSFVSPDDLEELRAAATD